jgi:hypothetical protein
LGVLAAGAVLAVGVEAVERVTTAERDAIHAALVALVGRDLGRDVRAWIPYLTSTVSPPAPPGEASPATTAPSAASPGPEGAESRAVRSSP